MRKILLPFAVAFLLAIPFALFAWAFESSGPVTPTTEVSTLSCVAGDHPETVVGFDANYSSGYCARSAIDGRWAHEVHAEVVCTLPEIATVSGLTITCA